MPNDPNPFQLISIEDPDCLIGRDDYLQTFLDVNRSAGSVYVTGLKRVGKTSLVKVGLRLLQAEGWVTVYMSVGDALGPDGAASDLVYGVLEHLEDATASAYPDLDLPHLEIGDAVNFARPASRWLTQLRRALPEGVFAAIAIDDFDDLPVSLRQGDEADALFRFLRPLVDQNWLSLTFVGSEVLPTLLEAQSHRLNQVDPIPIENFGSRDATAELLQKPTADRLDWHEEAIDAVHTLTSGNPYYSTLLGSRIWNALRERERTLVQPADVAGAARLLSSTENQGHFMHLWADDPTGLDAASSRAIQSSGVLRALARCSSSPGALVTRDEVVSVAQNWLQGALLGDLQATCSGLVRRGIVDETEAGRLRLRIPLVEMWLNSAGSRYLDEVYRSSSLAKVAARVVTASDYVGLARDLVFMGEAVNEIRLRAWVEQFADAGHRYLAFQILRRACTEGFFSNLRIVDEVAPVLKAQLLQGPLAGRLRRLPSGYHSGALVVEHGKPGSSAPTMIRPMLGALKIRKDDVTPLEEVAARARDTKAKVVIVLDEFSSSGKQLEGIVRQLADQLARDHPGWQEEVVVAVGIGVVAGQGALDRLGALPWDPVAGVVLNERHRAFSTAADIFDTESDRHAAHDLFHALGRSVWPDHPLGFSDDALLVVFESNCPNNSLPPLWRGGSYGGRDWHPLFERLR